MKSRIKKWGNSAAVRVPAAGLAAARMEAEQMGGIRGEDGRIIIEPVHQRRKYDIEELVKHITPENRHEEVDFGPPRGKEFW